MKKNSLRTLAVLLALLNAGSVFAACAAKDDSSGNDTTPALSDSNTSADTENYDSLEARRLLSDNLPNEKFDGQKYRVLTINEVDNYIASPEVQEGDVVEDAVFQRNSRIEDRFDVKIDVNSPTTHRETGALLERLVNAQDDAYEIYAGHAIVAGGNAVNGMFLNWHDIDYVDFTRPWWSQNSVEALTLNGRMFLVPTYYTISVIGNTYCMYYNKTIAADRNLENIYDVVNNKQWTLEKMRTMVADIYTDLNGNGKEDADDSYGLSITSLSPAVTFTWAFDMDIIEIDEDYNFEITFGSERNATIFEDLFNLYYRTTGVTTSGNNHSYSIATFNKGNTLLCSGLFDHSLSILREFEDPYAIIPYPKYDDQQEEYYSMLDGGHVIIGIPITSTNTAFAGLITEAMTAESWKYIIPNYYDVALKVKGARDEESIAMMDLIMNAVKVDLAYIYDNWNGYAFALQDMLQAKNENFASYVKGKMKHHTKWYTKVINRFTK